MNNIIQNCGTNPFLNLAVEEYLFDNFDGNTIMYLWQNKNTIVIGRTQNAFRECRVSEFEKDGGLIARRPTGGGAVFHDLGNLNFTFICSDKVYDEKRQHSVILAAVKSFGINAEFSGRNDLLAEGRKFSGNAFRHSKGKSMHHGTILFNADMSKLSNYLQVSKAKIESKGIKSVQSRVVNLCELNSGINTDNLKQSLVNSFNKIYGESKIFDYKDFFDEKLLKPYLDKYTSWQWRFGENPMFNTEINKKFAFGEVTLMLDVKNSVIDNIKIYSDALNTDFIASLEQVLKGLRYDVKIINDEVLDKLKDFCETKEFCSYLGEII